MQVEIVSDKFFKWAKDVEFYHDNIRIRNWPTLGKTEELDTEILVLDLDLSKRVNEYGQIPPVGGDITDVRSAFSGLTGSMIQFLENGGVIICLVAGKTKLLDLSSVDSHSWLNELSCVHLREKSDQKPLIDTSDRPPLQEYFEYVSTSSLATRPNRENVDNWDILARDENSGEPLAIAVNEYIDAHEIQRKANGHLILLPQPTCSPDNVFQMVENFLDIGAEYHKKEQNYSNTPTGLHLPKEIFDERLVEHCAEQFARGQHQSAVQNAFIALEERIRDLGDYTSEDHGTELITNAFNPGDGPLSFGQTSAEMEGIMHLYRGAYMSFRNPASHRFVEDINEVQAYHLLCLANLLLSLLEENQEYASENLAK